LNKHRASHNAVDYARWQRASTPYTIAYERFFEPYIIARKPHNTTTLVAIDAHAADMSAYDERFEGYGNDKDQLHFALAWRGARYVVLPDVFVMHFEHAPTGWARRRLPTMTRRWRTFAQFYAELRAPSAPH
jgi:hypothetical protein